MKPNKELIAVCKELVSSLEHHIECEMKANKLPKEVVCPCATDLIPRAKAILKKLALQK